MAYQTPITVREAVDAIWTNDYVLPAIQREFVWKPEQICRLFDSLMQGFPVGSFLFWKIEKETSTKFTFYGFVRDYHERDRPHCPPLGNPPEGSVTAVLDGQQRLTALNIGLRGSLAHKEPYKRWNNPDAFPRTRLYLDLGHSSISEDRNLAYRFEFLTDERAKSPRDNETWFLVSDVYAMKDPYAVIKYLSANNLAGNETAVGKLSQLQKVVHTDPVVSFYQEKNQDIEKVLNIFIRTNSGGTILSYSDLLLSIASSQWKNRDARQEIHNLVDELNKIRDGFDFSKDFVLKAGLMIADIGSVGFKVTNFNRDNMKTLEQQWDRISSGLKMTADLVGSFGLSRENIRADSALLPIAYYVSMRGLDWTYIASSAAADDRRAIKSWLIRSLLKSGIWGSGLDVLLTALRDVIAKHGQLRFPVTELEAEMRARGKSLVFADEEIDALVEVKYGNRELFGLMTILFPFVDTSVNQFHIDHVYPQTAFHANKLKKLEFSDALISELQIKKDQLPNLQLLSGIPNQEKSGSLPKFWLEKTYTSETDRADYVSRHGLAGCGDDMGLFLSFYDNRRLWLKQQLKLVLV
ncbi:DUF262 domain-containing protein [Mesorhizobium sp.]|uniref:DUF262 domain-containing protein n=1 Tax=Mesorhizobium sp. TaxID=1871066 RepID=UPI000FE7AD1D|nr:DUF262 domain-containing protein [Mesorhizobium sp.]RWP57276.1 MAG: DUF262 domain-containing protein [Mesorhizobium sp.]